MKNPPLNTWKLFKSALCQSLDATPHNKLLEAWESGPHKTAFYEWTLLPDVAKALGCQWQTERHRCDFAFLTPEGVPLIFAEAENAHPTAAHEIRHLCSLAAPLKVLFISCDWFESEKVVYLPRWQEIIRLHHSVVSMDCLYAIIVGGWDDGQFCEYLFTVINAEGAVVEEGRHQVKSTVGVPEKSS